MDFTINLGVSFFMWEIDRAKPRDHRNSCHPAKFSYASQATIPTHNMCYHNGYTLYLNDTIEKH